VCFLLRFVQKPKQSALSRHRFRSPQKKSKPHGLKSVPQNPHRIETRRIRLFRICEQKSNPHLLEISDGKVLSNGRTRLTNLRARLRIPNHQSPATTRSHLINGFRPLQMEELSIVSTRKGFVLRTFCLVEFCSIGAACKIFIFMRWLLVTSHYTSHHFHRHRM
jgi:hypothetical protein